MRILFITSMPLTYSGGLAQDRVKLLRSQGHQVDVLTKRNYVGMPSDVITVYQDDLTLKKIMARLRFLKWVDFLHLRNLFRKKKVKNTLLNGIFISNPDEINPPVPIEDVLAKITKKYDFVITCFLEHLLTIPSIKAIYDKLQCPIIIGAVDQAPFTGGCWFSLHCDRYKRECGKCPGLGSDDANDQTHINYLTKKQSYASMNYIMLTNSWMLRAARDSKLFDENRLGRSMIYLKEDKFIPMDRVKCKSMFGYKKNDFVLLSRYHPAKNKGLDVYIEALNLLYDEVDQSVQARVVVTFVGAEDESVKKKIKFRTKIIPVLSIEDLIKAYNAADYFVSPSISDAGPSMVNQSIMCGTPVICFNIGTALDVIENTISGYKTEDISPVGLKECLVKALSISSSQYQEMRKTSREIGLKYQSGVSYLNTIIGAYEKAKSFETK